METDLLNDGELSVRPYFNEYCFPADASNSVKTAMNLIRWTGGALALIVLALTVASSIKQRREEWQVLSLLGAERRQLQGILLRECISFGLLAMVLGVGSALLLFVISLPLLNRWIGEQLTYQISGPHVALTICLGMGMTVLAYLPPILYRKRRFAAEKKRKDRRLVYRCRNKLSKIPSFWSILLRQWLGRPGLLLVRLGLMVGMLAIFCLGLFLWRDQQLSVEAYQSHYGNTYTLISNSLGIPKKNAKNLLRIYGVESLETYQISDMIQDHFTADLTAYEAGTYFQRIFPDLEDLHRQREENGRIQREGEEAEEIEPFSASHTPVEIWTVGERELERFLQNLEDGYQLDPEAFARGEEAILIVPGITGTKVEGGWRYGTSMNPINWERSEKEGFPVCVEELARVGDVLTVSYRDISQEQVKIAGILQCMEEDYRDPVPPSYPSYALLTGEGWGERFPEWAGAEYYQYVRCQASWDADEVTDQLISQEAGRYSSVSLQNHRAILADMGQELFLITGFVLVIGSMAVLLLALILWGVARSDLRMQEEQFGIWESLGMKRRWRQLLQLLPACATSFCSIGITVAFLSWYHTERLNETAEQLGYRYEFALRLGISGELFALCCFLHFLLCAGMSVLPLWKRRIRKE